MPADDVTITATFTAEAPEPAPEGLKPITDDYTFVASDHFTVGIGDPKFLDDNRVYLSGFNTYSSGHGTDVEIPGRGVCHNVLGVQAMDDKTMSVVIQPAFDAEVTVYAEPLSDKTIIAGKRYNSAGLYLGEYIESAHTFTVDAGTTVFITGANRDLVPNTIYIAGITVKHIGSAASEVNLEDAADVAEAADAVEADSAEADDAAAVDAEPVEEIGGEKTVSESLVSEAELPTPDEAAKQ